MQTVKDHIKSDILQSAATLFLEKGYLKVPMREIAHKSGVGLSNIYNYFSCKDDIFVQIVTPAVRTFENMLDEHHGRRGTDIMAMCDRDYFKYMVDEYTSFIHRHRDLLLLLLSALKALPWRTTKKSLHGSRRHWSKNISHS